MANEKQLMTATPDCCIEHAKIRTHFTSIIVSGTVEEPFYEILYFDPTDGEYHIGWGSYKLANVFKWLSEDFEIMEDA